MTTGQAHRIVDRGDIKEKLAVALSRKRKYFPVTAYLWIVSAQPGLVPQMSGNLTASHITGATVFVDHVSRYLHSSYAGTHKRCHN